MHATYQKRQFDGQWIYRKVYGSEISQLVRIPVNGIKLSERGEDNLLDEKMKKKKGIAEENINNHSKSRENAIGSKEIWIGRT